MSRIFVGFIALVLVSAAPASSPAALVPLLGDGNLDGLAGTLRGVLIHMLPATLYDERPDWGKTKNVREVHWAGQGLRVHPEVREVGKNDGNWRHLRVEAVNLPDSLVFDLRNPRQTVPGPLVFDAFFSFDCRLEVEEQHWRDGVRLFSSGARARFRVRLSLTCEASSRLEMSAGPLPDLVFRLRITRADVGYDNLVFEHVGGFGGEAAKLLGDAAKGGLNRFHPNLERSLLDQADKAIVKAGDTREVRVSLGKLMK